MRDKVKPWQEKVVLVITGILILIGLIWAPFHIYDEQNNQINTLQNQLEQASAQHNPLLKFGKSTSVSISTDAINHTAYANITFNIVNVGNDAAYQFRSRICYAPLTDLHQISSYKDLIGTNPIMPTDEREVPITIAQPFTEPNGTIEVQSVDWLIYYQFRYSNAPTKGRFSTYDFYIVINFPTGKATEASTTEQQAFIPLVKTYYGNET